MSDRWLAEDVVGRYLDEARAAIRNHQQHAHEATLRRAFAQVLAVRRHVVEIVDQVETVEPVKRGLSKNDSYRSALGEIGIAAKEFANTVPGIVRPDQRQEPATADEEAHLALCWSLFDISRRMLVERNKVRSAFIAVVKASKDDLSGGQQDALHLVGDDLHAVTIEDAQALLRNLAVTVGDAQKRQVVRDHAVEQTCAVADLTRQFVEVCSDSRIGVELNTALEIDFAFRQALTKLAEIIPVLDAALKVVLVSPYGRGDTTAAAHVEFTAHRDRLRAQERVLRGLLKRCLTSYGDVLETTKPREVEARRAARQAAQDLRVNLGVFDLRDDNEDRAERAADRAEQVLREVNEAKEEANEAKEVAQQAAGDVGSQSQGAEFDKYSREQRNQAEVFRWTTLVLLALLVAAAITIVILYPQPTTDEIVSKLTIAIPASVLIAYTSRQAARHQAEARWARELAIKLHTLRAYNEPLKSAEQRIFRRDLGVQVFATSRKAKDDELPPAGIYGELVTVLGKVSEIIKGRDGSDDPSDRGSDRGPAPGAAGTTTTTAAQAPRSNDDRSNRVNEVSS